MCPRWLRRAACLLLVGCAACVAGKPAEAVRPDMPTAARALGESCSDPRNVATPLIVDWDQAQWGAIEAGMRSGLAVVAYDCHGIRLLADCRVEGSYGYFGVTRDERVVRLTSADQLSANLPKSGAALGVELGAELARGSSIDVALIMVGLRRTTRVRAASPDLLGDPASCEGATHFVRGAVVGAFAMDAGTQARVRSAAEVFGAGASGGSSSARFERTVKGSPDACAAAKPSDESPPPQCAAIYRLELVPLDAPASAAAVGATRAPAAVEASCPPGMVLAEAKCAAPASVPTHLCSGRDLHDCEAQCSRGHAGSCSNLGYMYTEGVGVAKDNARAARLFEQACGAGEALGCFNLALAYENGRGVGEDSARAEELYQKACDGGELSGCLNLGIDLQMPRHGIFRPRDPNDLARGAALFKKACDGGLAAGCYLLAENAAAGEGVPKDDARAAALYKRAADGDDRHACTKYGRALIAGRGVAADRASGIAYLRRGCKAGDDEGCRSLKELGEQP